MSGHDNEPPQDSVHTLRQSLLILTAESQALRNDVQRAEAARARANLINSVVLAALTAFVALLLAIGYQNNQLVHQSTETNRRIADCTTVGGKCYEDANARGQSAISDIIQVSIFMAQCARLYPGESGPGYDEKLESCIYQRLAAAQKRVPTPRPAPQPSAPAR